ncbi:hypothetical protein ACR218_001404 [Salmonella enterica]
MAKSGMLPPGFFWTDADNIDVPMTTAMNSPRWKQRCSRTWCYRALKSTNASGR